MTANFIKTIAACASVVTVSAVAVPAAHADLVFRNMTGRTLHFDLSCDGGAMGGWTVAPYGSRSLYCTNGSDEGRVRIRTDHGGFERVVRRTVYDGEVYELGYDDEGDVNIWRV